MKTRRRTGSPGKSSSLPHDFVKMVTEVFETNFADGLAIVRKSAPKAMFVAHGNVFPDEVVLTIALTQPGGLAATSVHASSDFDPRASAPTMQDVLGLCVDAIGSVYSALLDPQDPDKIAQVMDASLSALEDIPFEWTEFKVEKRKIYLLVDKSNPQLEEMTDAWLAKNDPDHAEREAQEHAETEKLFVTGESARKKRDTAH